MSFISAGGQTLRTGPPSAGRATPKSILARPEDIPIDRTTPDSSRAFGALFENRVYARRVIQLLGVWFLAYVTVFGFTAGFTSMLVSLNYPPPERSRR